MLKITLMSRLRGKRARAGSVREATRRNKGAADAAASLGITLVRAKKKKKIALIQL